MQPKWSSSRNSRLPEVSFVMVHFVMVHVVMSDIVHAGLHRPVVGTNAAANVPTNRSCRVSCMRYVLPHSFTTHVSERSDENHCSS